MAWPIVAAAGIAAAAQLGSSLSASRSAGSATKQGRSFALHQGNIDFARQYTWREDEHRREDRLRAEDRAFHANREDTAVRRRVQDARGAGLHPLFAMGQAGYNAPAFNYQGSQYRSSQRSPTYPPSGSHAAEGIAQVGRIAANAINDYGVSKKQDELHELRVQKMAREIQLDDMALLAAASELKRAEQQGLYWGDSNPGITGDGSVRVSPYTRELGVVPQMRPLVETPRKSMAMRSEVIGDDGYRYRIIDPETGDELSQIDLAQQIILRHTRKARLAPGRELKIWAARQAAKIKRAWLKGLKSTRERRQR